MSEPVTALKGASFTDGIATVREVGPLGMITLRGDLSVSKLRTLVKKTTGTDFPGVREAQIEGDHVTAWMSPDELLLVGPYADVSERMARMHAALADSHALAVNVSDARAVFDLSGPQARAVLAKLAPVDLAPGRFEAPMFRRTRLAQVPAAFWMTDAQTFRIVCFRSVGQYVFDLLKVAAQPGSEVDRF